MLTDQRRISSHLKWTYALFLVQSSSAAVSQFYLLCLCYLSAHCLPTPFGHSIVNIPAIVLGLSEWETDTQLKGLLPRSIKKHIQKVSFKESCRFLGLCDSVPWIWGRLQSHMGRSCPDSVCTVSPAVAHGTAVPSPNCYHLCTSWWFLQIQPRLSSCLLCLCLSYFHTSYLSYHYFFLTFHSLLLLSHFSRVRLCATPETEAHQAPPPLGFSRQERLSGLPFPSPMHESEKWKGSRSVVSDS